MLEFGIVFAISCAVARSVRLEKGSLAQRFGSLATLRQQRLPTKLSQTPTTAGTFGARRRLLVHDVITGGKARLERD
jgi:hypothetical protein